MEDINPYTGYSVLFKFLGWRSSRYIHSTDFYFYIALLLLMVILAFDNMLFRKGKPPPPVSVNTEFV